MNCSLHLKKLADQRKAIIVPGVANALSARVIALKGFEAVYVSGAGLSNTFIGKPDIGLLTLTELVDNLFRIRDVVDIPIVVDADTGFGNEVGVNHCIRALERAGANAIQIEDQAFPKRCGHFRSKKLIPVDEMVSKIKSALDSRCDQNMMIISRTDAVAVNGLDDALDRASAYIEAGADMTFVEAPQNEEDLEKIATHLSAPQVANMVIGGQTPLLKRCALKKMGFGFILYANVALQASLLGMKNALEYLKNNQSMEGGEELVVDFEERQAYVNKAVYDELEKKYA